MHNQITASENGRLPDFVIIGAMKSGTTTLHRYLQRHPDVCMSVPKEPMFFSRDNVYARGERWYRSLFAPARPRQICGEASTCYTRRLEYPRAARRSAQHLPDARFIYVLRHPVDRAYSHYAHIMEHRIALEGQPVIPLDRALRDYPTIVDTSNYARQIERWLEFFPIERFHFVLLDDLQHAPADALAGIQSFLGLAPRDLLRAKTERANPTGNVVVRQETQRRLAALRASPGAALIRRIAPPPLKRTASQLAEQLLLRSKAVRSAGVEFKRALTPLTTARRAELLQVFREPTRRLEQILGRDLSRWQR